MQRTDVIVIGAGQAGLAVSHYLATRSVDHVVFERGRIAERWRSERWDSLRTLTPNWQSRLPGYRYRGPDPNGFMTMAQLVRYFGGYARSFSAPVREYTTVHSVARRDDGYRVVTDGATWSARAVIVATGHCDRPTIPSFAGGLDPSLFQTVPTRYRRPEALPAGGVLVVGAAASGIQIADELQRAGRDVTIAVGRHTRLPRRYRGLDIMQWLDRTGILAQRTDDVRDLEASRRTPSMQLVGRPDHATLDLQRLAARGVRLVGRATGGEGTRLHFADDLATTLDRAQRKLDRLLDRIDAYAASHRFGARLPDPDRPAPLVAPASRPMVDLRDAGISTVIWATGFHRHYPWLDVPVLDARGEIVHDGGVTSSPGLYALGLRFQSRRDSSFIDGVRHDAAAIASHVHHHLRGETRLAA